MPNQTPDRTFQYPEAGEYPWWQSGYQMQDPETDEIITQESDGLVDWLEQIEARSSRVVQTYSDLPDNNPYIEDPRTGKRRHFLVLDDQQIVYDTGQEWVTVAGLGSSAQPLEEITTSSVRLTKAPTDPNQVARLKDTSGGSGSYGDDIDQLQTDVDQLQSDMDTVESDTLSNSASISTLQSEPRIWDLGPDESVPSEAEEGDLIVRSDGST